VFPNNLNIYKVRFVQTFPKWANKQCEPHERSLFPGSVFAIDALVEVCLIIPPRIRFYKRNNEETRQKRGHDSDVILTGSVKDVDDGFIGNRLALGSRYQCHPFIDHRRQTMIAPYNTSERNPSMSVILFVPSFSTFILIGNTLIWFQVKHLRLTILDPMSQEDLSRKINTMLRMSRPCFFLIRGERKMRFNLDCVQIDSLRHVRHPFRHCKSNCDQISAQNVVYGHGHTHSTAKGHVIFHGEHVISAPLVSLISTARKR
jgi:hypothetical protein